jgi:ABC-2 type transport system permease protein
VKSGAPALSPPAPRRRGFGATVGHQFRYDSYMYVRNYQSLVFTLFMPVMFLVIFASVFGHGRVTIGGLAMSESVYYVPGIIALGVINASFGNLAASVVGTGEAGIYKRRRATPAPAAALISARALVAVVVSLAITVLLLAIGYAYGAAIPVRTAPALVLDVVVSALGLCCLGFALASIISNRDAVMPIVLGVTLPLYFISGVFVPSTQIPNWLLDIAAVFPVRHMATALLAVYSPSTKGSGARWGDLAVIVAWGAVGLVVAIRRFSWLPRGG